MTDRDVTGDAIIHREDSYQHSNKNKLTDVKHYNDDDNIKTFDNNDGDSDDGNNDDDNDDGFMLFMSTD